ncbi:MULTISPECIES: hypothetical protein [Klebsiella/Raoultella group]|uniref:hypothetical protein n=1 Tax=Klebsiella/Raoultella group TaxID=2890311 RepID=UPI0007D6DCBC|nr:MULTISPECIES: hypothetical protein [Klebsiella/Raoultella group]MBB7254710.1 hypothetical protein [Escherichia coli]MCT4739284.1 hypothetical protein [Raoultella ornithinolytica]MDW1426949.1 hypothetical protein [Klebsiella pneumoniae]PUH08389.1 hypothetical protein DB355_24260 [Klebsiella pneumoniae]QDJ82055.1 hypothetical protein CI661_0009240 [Klebsiella pneumoniae subsp. pneumoniae]
MHDVEATLTVNSICNIGANTRIVETSDGYAVIDVPRRPQQGDTVLIRYDGRMEFAKVMGRALITADGEAIEGEALDDVEVGGVVTHTIIDLMQDDSPV